GRAARRAAGRSTAARRRCAAALADRGDGLSLGRLRARSPTSACSDRTSGRVRPRHDDRVRPRAVRRGLRPTITDRRPLPTWQSNFADAAGHRFLSLAVERPTTIMYDTILVPTDGSTGAHAAAQHALALADAFDSRLQFLSVVNAANEDGLVGLDSIAERRTVLDEEAADALESLEALAAETDVAYETAIEHGTVHETILDIADRDADLVAMGTHGRTGLQRVLIGSVTERVG